jgi:hypothetical protein
MLEPASVALATESGNVELARLVQVVWSHRRMVV